MTDKPDGWDPEWDGGRGPGLDDRTFIQQLLHDANMNWDPDKDRRLAMLLTVFIGYVTIVYLAKDFIVLGSAGISPLGVFLGGLAFVGLTFGTLKILWDLRKDMIRGRR